MADLTGRAVGFAGPTSSIFTAPFPHQPGTKATDNFGNEYVFCPFLTTNVSGGILVAIDSAHNAAPLLGTETGARRVGVAMTGATAGTNAGWVQIYGIHVAVQAAVVSDLTSANTYAQYILIPQTSVGTPSGVLALALLTSGASSGSSTLANEIFNMWIAEGDVSNYSQFNSDISSDISSDTTGPTTDTTATTNGTSMHFGTSLPVFLNYPYVLNQTRAVMISDTSTT